MTSINELVKRNDISGLITALNEDAAWYTRDQAGKALIDIGEPAVEALLATLKNNKADVHLGLDVVKILKQIGDKRMLFMFSK